MLVKAWLAVTVLITQTIALCKRSVPYFPIEISRTVAANETTKYAFLFGVVSLLLPIMYTGDYLTYMPVWCALVMLAYYDDKSAWTVHMLGVAMALVCASFRIYEHGMIGVNIIALASTAYLSRVIIKLVCVNSLEFGRGSIVLLYDTKAYKNAFQKSMAITRNGAEKCNYPRVTLAVFKLGGVLQWLAFYLLSLLF